MKILIQTIVVLLLLVSSQTYGQAHLGYTEGQIKALYPENGWKTGYTNDGVRYLSTFFGVELFFYYFSKDSGRSVLCTDIIPNASVLNGVVEKYNHKYVVTSDTSWTAYLEKGGIMYITLNYNQENKVSYFSFTPAK